MIYFDNAATTMMASEVKEKLNNSYDNFWANPSSLHRLGFNAEKEIKAARESISKSLKVNAKNLFFVPSGTIANNAVLHSFDMEGKNIVLSEVEHSSSYYASQSLKSEIRYVKVDKFGFIDEEDLLLKIDENTVLVSILHANNELGTINNINKLSEISKAKNSSIFFHSDGVQAFTKIDIDLSNIDMYTISSHKINGPKGIAALYIKNIRNFNSLYQGGGQESNLFSGTENVPAILGFAEAVKLSNNYEEINSINSYLREEIRKIKDCIINSPENNVSPYTLNVCFKGIGAEILLHYLEMEEIYISTGSACSKDKDSRVISAIEVDKEYKNGCVRISLSRFSTMDEAKVFVEKLREKVETIRGILGWDGY